MPTARKNQIDLSMTKHYHCVSRCVRRAFLCGRDEISGKSFDHRKGWLVEKMKSLTHFFAIDICAYAVMSNHYHLVLRVDQDRAIAWSDKEVVVRWASLFKFSKAKQLMDAGLDLIECEYHQESIAVWRERLYDLSWFMRVLNESIAREANKEDDCKGRFWEGRFKSQALLDEAAILTCMAYVDLNPVRAGVSNTPDASDFTSIQDRIRNYKESRKQPKELAPLKTKNNKNPVDIGLRDYFHLVDTSGRIIREGKRGSIPKSIAPILERLDISTDNWLTTLQRFGDQFETFVGKPASIKEFRRSRNHLRMRGLAQAEKAFRSAA